MVEWGSGFVARPPRGSATLRSMRAYALVTAESPEEAVDVFLRREDAHAALAGCLRDEPD